MPEEAGGADDGSGLMSGGRGWIIVLSVVVLEAVFFIVLLKLQADKKPADTELSDTFGSYDSKDFMRKEIPLDRLTYSIPMPSGQPMTLAMDMVIILEPTVGEIREKVVISEGDWQIFNDTVKKMLPWVRDQLNRMINRMSSSEINTERGQNQIREFVREQINTKLQALRLDLSNPKIRKERVTQVLITNFYISN